MGSKSDQVKGLANQAIGKLKKGVGKMTGSTGKQAKRCGSDLVHAVMRFADSPHPRRPQDEIVRHGCLAAEWRL
jgi:hypothetical protein